MGRRARERAKKKDVYGYILIIGVVSFLIFATYYITKETSQRIEVNENTFCPVNNIKKRTIVLIDRSTTFTPTRAESISKRIKNIKDNLDKHENIQIFTVGDISKNVRKPYIDLCNPGTGKGVSWLKDNPNIIDKIWKDDFSEKVEDVIDYLAKIKSNEEKSPIFESIESISATSLDSSIEIKFYIFSDFIQNVSDFSQYTHPEPYNFEKFLQSEYGKKSKTELYQAKIYMRVYKDSFKKKELRFWQKWFTESNSGMIDYKRIP